jgi:short-subunit dehydrogenase
MNPNYDLLIVGGSSSLGKELIIQAKNRGLSFLSTFRSVKSLDNSDRNWLELDIENTESVDSFLRKIYNVEFTTIIFCIGALSQIRLKTLSAEQIYKYFKTHITNATYLITKLTENLQKNSHADLIYISSRSAIYPSFDFCYAASKSALTSVVSSLSRQIPHNHSTHVMTPGLIKGSNMYLKMEGNIREDHEKRSNYNLLTLEEVANFILNFDYPASPSGSVIEVGPSYK